MTTFFRPLADVSLADLLSWEAIDERTRSAYAAIVREQLIDDGDVVDGEQHEYEKDHRDRYIAKLEQSEKDLTTENRTLRQRIIDIARIANQE